MNEQQQLERAIAGLEAQRAGLGDAVVEAALAPLRARLAMLCADAAPPAQQLRQISLLFADIVGSTTLSRVLEPEDIHAVMDGALERFATLVQAHHGRVLQYAGDSLLAAFGADEAHEDDAENAVRAGLALLSDTRSIAAQVQQQYGLAGFDLRVGVHTGAVLLGGGVDADSTVRGISVNIAARMEQSAPPGSLRISHDTYRHVRGVFDVSEQPPIEVKGLAEPMRSYALSCLGGHEAARDRAERGLALARGSGDRQQEAQLLAVLAEIAADRGDLGGSIVLDEQAVQIARAGGYRRLEALVFGNLASRLSSVGDWAQAKARASRCACA